MIKHKVISENTKKAFEEELAKYTDIGFVIKFFTTTYSSSSGLWYSALLEIEVNV